MRPATQRLILIIVGVLLVANLAVFFTYRVRQQERIDSLRSRRAQLEDELRRTTEQRDRTRQQIAAVAQLERELDTIFNQTWGEPDERLTPLLRELNTLASRSGLQPPSRAYSNEQTTREGEATAMTISFNVRGSYEQLRRMINLIESSEQYVVIDSLSLSGDAQSGDQLQISLQLRTLFREEPLQRRRPGQQARRSS